MAKVHGQIDDIFKLVNVAVCRNSQGNQADSCNHEDEIEQEQAVLDQFDSSVRHFDSDSNLPKFFTASQIYPTPTLSNFSSPQERKTDSCKNSEFYVFLIQRIKNPKLIL